jgi:flagellar hook-length control protein FliK
VSTQLATVLAPAAHQPDGSYQVNIRLQPEDLGVVHVELHLEAGTVNVSLHAEGDATRDMLRQNLGQLRQQMAGTGLSTGRFDVSGGTGSGADGSAGGGHTGAGATNEDQDGPGTDDTDGAASAAGIPPLANGQLDVRL